MKTLFRNFFTVRIELKVLLLSALLAYFLIELYLIHIPEIFNGGYVLGQFVLKCCQSYISAFIFYFFVVHIKNEKDKQNVNEYVSQKVSHIITASHLFFESFYDKKTEQIDLDDRTQLNALLKSIKRKDESTCFSFPDRKATWLEWWEYLKEGTENDLKQIFLRLPYLDSELIKILTRIENSTFFKQWNMLYYIDHEPSFSIYEFNVLTYRNLIAQLDEYRDRKLTRKEYRDKDFYGIKDEFIYGNKPVNKK